MLKFAMIPAYIWVHVHVIGRVPLLLKSLKLVSYFYGFLYFEIHFNEMLDDFAMLNIHWHFGFLLKVDISSFRTQVKIGPLVQKLCWMIGYHNKYALLTHFTLPYPP